MILGWVLSAILAAAPAAAAGVHALPAARSSLNFHWGPAEKSAYFKELNLHLDALSGLGVPSAPASLPAAEALAYLEERAGRSLVTPVQLAARQTLLEGLARPARDLPVIADLLRSAGRRGAAAAEKLEALSERTGASPEGARLRRGLGRLRRAMLPPGASLEEGSGEVNRLLTAAFDGEPFGWEEDPPAPAVRWESSDRRYGAFNQHDPRLEELGLFRSSWEPGTNLCGPTCLLNAALKLLGRRGRALDPVEELGHMSWDLPSAAGVSAERLLRKGLNSYELADMARAYFREKGWRASAWVHDDPFRITENALRAAAEGDAVVILSYSRYQRGRRGRPKRTGGHFLLLTGLQSLRGGQRSLRALVQDPATGEQVVRLTRRGRRRFYELEFEDAEHPDGLARERLVLEDFLVIRLLGRLP